MEQAMAVGAKKGNLLELSNAFARGRQGNKVMRLEDGVLKVGYS